LHPLLSLLPYTTLFRSRFDVAGLNVVLDLELDEFERGVVAPAPVDCLGRVDHPTADEVIASGWRPSLLCLGDDGQTQDSDTDEQIGRHTSELQSPDHLV